MRSRGDEWAEIEEDLFGYYIDALERFPYGFAPDPHRSRPHVEAMRLPNRYHGGPPPLLLLVEDFVGRTWERLSTDSGAAASLAPRMDRALKRAGVNDWHIFAAATHGRLVQRLRKAGYPVNVPPVNVDDHRESVEVLRSPPPCAAMRQRWCLVRRAAGARSASAGRTNSVADALDVLAAELEEDEDSTPEEAIDRLVQALDMGIEHMLDAVLHHPAVLALEASWRAARYLVDHIEACRSREPGARVELLLLQATHPDLRADLARSGAERGRGLEQHWVIEPWSRARPRPLAVIVDLGAVGREEADIDLLEALADVARRALAPLVTNAADAMFGEVPLHQMRDLNVHFGEDAYARWNAFRSDPASQMVAVACRRVRARAPYRHASENGWTFHEEVSGEHDGPPWLQPAVLLAANIVRAFSKDGVAAALTTTQAPGPGAFTPPWFGEAPELWSSPLQISDRREYELSEQGLIAWLEDSDLCWACVFAATHTCLRPRIFANTAEGREREVGYRLLTKLGYVLYVLRFAQHVRALARSRREWPERQELERTLRHWLRRACRENAEGSFWLEQAQVELAESDGGTVFKLALRPWRRDMSSPFTLRFEAPIDP